MKLSDFIAEMERIAPPELALPFDNPGLLISPEREEVTKVLVALDCTCAVAREAAAWGADLVLTHHPLFFRGVKHVRTDDPETAAAWLLIRNGIGMYAAHTNLDAAEGGVNDALLGMFGARDIRPLGTPDGIAKIGTLPEEMTLLELKQAVDRALGTVTNVIGAPEKKIRTLACVGGSGAEDAAYAAQAGADAFLTGEMKHHEGLCEEARGTAVLCAGHYETERVVLKPLIERLQNGRNDVQYKLALSDKGPFWR